MINPVITLKWALLVITVIQVNADDTHGIEKRDTNGETAKRIVCYYTNWSVYRPGTAKFSPQNINPYLCTHLIYAFGGLDKENGLRPYDKYQDIEQGGYAKFTGLKTYNKNLKTMLAIGGWNEGSSRFSALVGDEERRAIFVKNVVKFLRQNNFDGLDLDWEYPAFRDGSKSADKENYASLVKELREEFEKESSKTGKPRLLLTMAVPAGIEYIDKGYDVPKLNRYLDFMNILSYDYHSAYEPNVNHHSPLYSLQEESEYNFDAQLTIDHTIKHYLKKGADREKLVLGIPTYGRSYTLFNADSTDLGSPADGPGEQGEATREKGYLAYYEICANLDGDKSWNVIQPKKSAMGPYAYRGNQWVSYDDADIVKLKAKYVNEKSLGGIMYWSIDNDDFRGKCHGKPYPLIEAGKESLLSSGGSSINAISSTSADEKRPSKLTNKRNRPKSQNVSTTTKQPSTTSATTTVTTAPNPLSTPEPPTTPDPGTDFVCKEEGFFPHPRDCKKYFWCLDSGPSNLGIVAHQFTCPSGLMFNKAADSCDYSRNVICNKKPEKTSSPTTTPTIKTTSKSPVSKPGTTTSSTTTTTTTTSEPSVEEYYEEEDADSQEDPKAIKQLITLIKKLGGIAELEKQLKLEDGSTEVTTPAISKNLYNKVFSSPTSSRHRNQNRNGPSGPQHEATASNNDVPYYRKDKPQYVTIQRSRPLKNVAQDTEDSGTTNNKSIEPSKYHDTVDYAEDDATESEPFTTVKYSTPTRYRSSTAADGRTTSLKYVVLERNKSDRITTSDEEPRAESPSTTQRYITLVRQRPSLTAATEYEEAITEPSTPQRSSPPVTEKVKEKVSEIETTYLPVTSAQYDTDKAQTLYTNEYSDTTANPPNTHLVYAQKAFGHGDELAVDTTTTLLGPTTETDLVPSTSISVITTIRESPTEKTRLSLKRYKEYLKNNKTYLLHELRSNSVPDETLEHISPAQESSKGDSPLKKPYFSRKRPAFVSATSTTTTETSPLNKTHAFTLNSRFFSRRNKNASESTTSPVEHTSTAESTRENSRTSAKSSDESSKENGDGNVLNTNSDKSTTNTSTYAPSSSKYRTPFRSRNQGTTIPESDSIGSFFKKRRFSTTEETYVDVTTSGGSSTAKGSRYFSRNRKTSPQTTESASTTNSPTTSTTAKYSRKNGGVLRKPAQSEILDSDENRYQISAQTSTTRQPSQTTTTTTTESTATSTVEFHEFESTPKETRNNDSSTTGDVQDLGPEVEASSVATFKILRNNSRFLKNPESKRSEYVGVKGTRIRGETRYSTDDNDHRFSSPIRAIAHPNKNEIRVGAETKEKLSSPSRAARDGNGDDSDVGTRRGRKKFFDNLKESTDVNATETTTADRQRSRHSQTITNSSANAEFKYEPMRRTRPIVVVASTASSTPSSPQHSISYPNDHQARSRTLQTPSRNWNELATPPTTTQFHATAPATIDVHSRRRSKAQLFNVTDSAASKTTATTENTKRTVTRNRGKIKAQNSLSQAEIRELTSSSDVAAEMGIRKKPKPIVEETFVTNADSVQLQPNRGLYTLVPTLLERSFEETTDTDNTIYALDGNNNYEAYLKNNEIFGTSETKYSNIDNHLDEDDETTTTTADESETHFPSRYREHFRRTTSSSRSRSRPTTIATTTTTTTEYSPSNESAKLASRFRRRKIKPENRSIGNSKNENIVSSIHSTEISTTRPKSIDVSQRGSTTISDYLPVPASLYRINNASNFDSYNVGSVNLEDLEAQTINTQSNYYNNEDVSDLADPAVVAIHSLKTVPPASSTVTVSRTVVPISSQIGYTEEISLRPFPRIKTTPTSTSRPSSKSRPSIRRGTVRVSSKTTTTTNLPSLQDIYTDYRETDLEYHADPVEIPITGKVRIHSDGYIECLDMGNFPHPFSCKKFISCAKMEYDSLLGWEYTCPKGLSFDPIGGICNWAAGLGCKE